jgi:hypothetical protein
VALGVRILGLDRLGEAEQRLPVGDLEPLVALLELLGALADDDVEELLAVLQLLLVERSRLTRSRCSSTRLSSLVPSPTSATSRLRSFGRATSRMIVPPCAGR